ncbi:MAG TPA: YeeE/YedE thiosulfate transporter family protein [Kofleriaceae bacterium]|nr:YeeE/YedE thiosulfate transporter family protein [Kofleriaceae bacterium]
MPSTWFSALLGGALIGCASALLLLAHGRIAGISGITGGLLQRATPDRGWRLAFLGGLIAAGVVASVIAPTAIGQAVRPLAAVIAAGLLVGFGTRLGNGCTSGHGVCGLSRWSARSLVAVVTFMATGAITAILAGRLS